MSKGGGFNPWPRHEKTLKTVLSTSLFTLSINRLIKGQLVVLGIGVAPTPIGKDIAKERRACLLPLISSSPTYYPLRYFAKFSFAGINFQISFTQTSVSCRVPFRCVNSYIKTIFMVMLKTNDTPKFIHQK